MAKTSLLPYATGDTFMLDDIATNAVEETTGVERRGLGRMSLAAALTAGAAMMASKPAEAQTVTDMTIMNFALNFEYLGRRVLPPCPHRTGPAARRPARRWHAGHGDRRQQGAVRQHGHRPSTRSASRSTSSNTCASCARRWAPMPSPSRPST